jgi:predicted ArsR family transcriptional regulator
MVSDGRLAVRDGQGGGRRGRPARLYGVSDALRGNNLAGLSDLLLSEIRAGEPDLNRAMTRLGREMAGFGPMAPPESLPKRLSAAIRHLNALNYDSHWEAGATGPRMVLGHCPYAAIIEAHPELCRMDEAMLERLTGGIMKQIAKIGDDGSANCVFAWKQMNRAELEAGTHV